ncbi:MAG: glycosyltransferase [Bacteroidales bacterium]|jgi:cellulose synthase/poly-beta-1,6-N-acetylglucosamine synthase-like glycosyltransferase|nr:glycosyltransferase [Bacteroidales bacterium]
MFGENILLTVVFLVFALTAALQLFYYFYYYLAVWLHKDQVVSTSKKPVSVIICARNEAENLANFLPSVLEQDYPDYEVIVVNDCSEDNTYKVLGEYLIKYPHLKVSNVNKDPKFTHNKKFAQFIGIKAARNDILVFTDADCKPESVRWLEGMTSHFNGSTHFVLGYGGYIKGKGLLNKYIIYETMTIALQFLGMAIRGIPYMGVGRNLAYLRTTFFENKGFGAHNHIISGDDDLFVNNNATGNNTAVEFRNGTITRSVSCPSFSKWITQKKRHLTTAPYYKSGDKFRISLEPLSRILFYMTFIILLSRLFLWQYVLIIFGLRLISMVTVLTLGQKRLNESGLTGFSLIFDIFSPVIAGILLLSNIRKRPGQNQWK